MHLARGLRMRLQYMQLVASVVLGERRRLALELPWIHMELPHIFPKVLVLDPRYLDFFIISGVGTRKDKYGYAKLT